MKDIVGAIAEEEKYKKNRLIYADNIIRSTTVDVSSVRV